MMKSLKKAGGAEIEDWEYPRIADAIDKALPNT
jgi:hypothetical protein